MTQPKRIQRRRIKGWRMPSTAIYVGRGTPWGNPFTVDTYGRERAVALFREHLVEIKRIDPKLYRERLEPLRGKDLACFCRLDQVCHADVLLELVAELEESSDGKLDNHK